MGNQGKIYGAGAVNIDASRSNFPFSLHRNLSEKHIQQHVVPICQTLGLVQIWYHGSLAAPEECRKRNEKEKDGCKIKFANQRQGFCLFGQLQERKYDLCSSNSLSKYHLFVIFGVEILLPIKYLCENVYGAGAVKNDGCQELGKQQNVV